MLIYRVGNCDQGDDVTHACNCMTVTLAELTAAVDGVPPAVTADEVGMNWRGEPAVTAAVAARAVEERKASVKRQQLEERAWRMAQDDRAVLRAEHVRTAAAAARDAFLARVPAPRASMGPDGPSGPIIGRPIDALSAIGREQLEDRVRAASEEAAAAFDRKQPEQSRDQWIRANAKHLESIVG